MPNEIEGKRFQGSGSKITAFLNNILVQCPSCSKDATVFMGQDWSVEEARIVCSHCSFTEKSSNLIRYEFQVTHYCDNCNKLIDVSIKNRKKLEQLALSCPYCDFKRTYTPTYHEVKLAPAKNHKIHDPIFKLSLWLQIEVKGKILWALNYEHLTEIKKYVTAKLRERKEVPFTTMVEKLPQFIKEAKNRGAILKAIKKLEVL